MKETRPTGQGNQNNIKSAAAKLIYSCNARAAFG